MSETHIMHFCHDCAERARAVIHSIEEQHEREIAALRAELDRAVACLDECARIIELRD